MTRKKTKFCLSWPNKTLKIAGRLQNIVILLTERTIMPYSNLILPLSALFYRMWRHFLSDDSDTQKVPGVAECSPPPPNFHTKCHAALDRLRNNFIRKWTCVICINKRNLKPLRVQLQQVNNKCLTLFWRLQRHSQILNLRKICDCKVLQ